MDTPKGMKKIEPQGTKDKFDFAKIVLNTLEGFVSMDITILSVNVYTDIENNTKRMSIDIDIKEVDK